MILFLEIASLILAGSLCIICSCSDLKNGIISNKTVLRFAIVAIAIDALYYGVIVKDLLFPFLLNVLAVSFVSLYLFFSHSFAGGDCKMVIVLSLLYPARYYLSYRGGTATLIFALGFSLLAGYVYLLITSLVALGRKKVELSIDYIRQFLQSFLKSYLSAMAYIILLNSILMLLEQNDLILNIWIVRCACILVAWCVGRYPVFKKPQLLLSSILFSVGIFLITRTLPISINPENYILVLILLLCQMTIRTTIYESIPVNQLSKGMILTTFSSVLMQSSITKGLPGVSTEDLRSRLTSDEIASIKIWAKATHTEHLTIVKKIPFAIFISVGFLSYFLLWRLLLCI